jgi:hypothetical protein
MSDKLPMLSYAEALSAYESGQKLHKDGRIYLVRPVPQGTGQGLVLWVTDERTLGDFGLLLHPDGRVEAKQVR